MMGMCGCSEGLTGYRFPGPKGFVYVLELYPGCTECESPAGVVVVRYRKGEEMEPEYEEADEAVFVDYRGKPADSKSERAERAFPVVDVAKVVDAVKATLGGVECIDGRDRFRLSELIDADGDELREAIGGSIHETMRSAALDSQGGEGE